MKTSLIMTRLAISVLSFTSFAACTPNKFTTSGAIVAASSAVPDLTSTPTGGGGTTGGTTEPAAPPVLTAPPAAPPTSGGNMIPAPTSSPAPSIDPAPFAGHRHHHGHDHDGGDRWGSNPPDDYPWHVPVLDPSCPPETDPVKEPMPPIAPPPTPPTPPVCTAVDMSKLSALMIQRFTYTVTDVAYNCIDSYNLTLQQNMPTGDGSFPEVRFMNTCGNRFCQAKLGFESGRVIEISPNGAAVVECVHSTPPSTGNSCEGVVSASPLITHVATSVGQTALECRDSAVPQLQDNMPGVYPGRFVDTCGKRSCQLRGYRDGRVIEFANDNATLECYQDPGHFFVDAKAQMADIARNCIDSSNPNLADNGPDVNLVRYMSTCGDRYCRGVLGQRSGKVVEFNDGIATLTCVAQ